MNVNEIKYYFDPEQLNSYSISWCKEDHAFRVFNKLYANTKYNELLIESPRKWLNLGVADNEDNAQYYSMTQNNDTIFIFLQSVKDGNRTSKIKEFSSFEEAQEFVANHFRTEASYIKNARYSVTDEASLFAMRNMIKNLKPFYF